VQPDPSLNQLFQTIDLPIVEQIPAIRKCLSQQNKLILQAQPGAGKTSLVPLALLSLIPQGKKILLLEPRRLAAKNAALRMASLLGERVGDSVGYRIRGETRVSAGTSIEVVTEAILNRMLLADPELSDIALVIFDEFHERNLDADVGLAFSLEVQQTLRPDLKLLVMSATLNTAALSHLMAQATVIEADGRSYPVSVEYLPATRGGDWRQVILRALFLAKEKTDGDILVFLPGKAEILQVKQLASDSKLTGARQGGAKLEIHCLYGDLPFEQQQKIIVPAAKSKLGDGIRKLILSTNIAETSITIEGVRCVIDSGLVRQSVFDPNVGFNRLITQRISNSSAVQRAGRAGRVAPGHCIRLWSASEQLRADPVAEILRADLASFVLELSSWGASSPAQLALLQQPNEGALAQARELLTHLGLINAQYQITARGSQALRLAVHPRLGNMLLGALDFGALELACLIAAIVEEQSAGSSLNNQSDFSAILSNFIAINSRTPAQRRVADQARQLRQKIGKVLDKPGSIAKQRSLEQTLEFAPVLLALVFPERIAQKRGSGYRMANGVGAQRHPEFELFDEYLVIIQLGGQSKTARIFQAIAIDKAQIEEIFCGQLTESESVEWDVKKQSVSAQKQIRLGQLILDSKPLSSPSPEQVQEALVNALVARGLENLPWSAHMKQWQARVNRIRQLANFAAEFPDISIETLKQTARQWLAPHLLGFKRLSQVTGPVLEQALKSLLSWPQQQLLDRLMPESITVPSGTVCKIDYLCGGKPVLAVKLQEMFGQPQTPSIANGQISLLIHLLSPARRPLQVTEDLASFWADGYQSVKKEMRGRYPKHPWPDDPVSAQPTRYTKKRSK